VFAPDLDTILFDAGGTLVHVDYAHVVEIASRRGVAIDPERMPRGDAAARIAIDQRLGVGGHEDDSDHARVPEYFEAMMLGLGVAPDLARELGREIRASHHEDVIWRVPFADAAEALAALRGAGLATAVVSNADGRVRDLLDRAGLLAHLDYVIDSSEEGVEKPDPEIFRRAVERSGTHPARALYVGDVYSIDVLGARAAGLAACLLDPTGSYAGVDCPRVPSLAELARRLLAGRGG
jgi:putative hydrolase of the HAD superfamily